MVTGTGEVIMEIKAGFYQQFHNFTLDIDLSTQAKRVGILGASGVGKSMTLKMLAGILTPQKGFFSLDGKVLLDTGKRIDVPPQKRRVGYLFQNYALFPAMTVEENIGAGITAGRAEKGAFSGAGRAGLSEMKKKITGELIERFHLDGLEKQFPSELSGGQQQRVALARALVLEPGVLLFDEPLSNLDAKLRVTMRTEIRKIQQKVGITAVYVTHDQSEAMSISDKIIIMSKGKVEQIGTPQDVYYRPKSRFVADFIGEANFLDTRVDSADNGKAVITISGQTMEVNNYVEAQPGDEVSLVLRPEAVTLSDTGQLPCEVILSTFMGSYQYYHVKVGDITVQITDYNPVNKKIYQVGDKASLAFDPSGVYILPKSID